MKKKFFTISEVLRKLAKHNLLLLLGFLTITHVIVLSFYFQKSGVLSDPDNQSFVSHPLLLLTINTSQTIPVADMQKLASSLTMQDLRIHNKKISISIDPQPKWKLRFNKSASLQTVLSLLPKNKSFIHLSYQLNNNVWLNYSEITISSSYSVAVLLVVMEMILIGLVLFYNFSLQRFSIPLHNFKRSAERLGIDVNATPIRVYGTKLVRETANAMNKMQARLQDLIHSRTRMLAAISHDLRTPITRLKLRAYFIEDENQAKKMSADLDEMETMINDILLFAREDFTKDKKIIFDLNALLAAICDDYADENRIIHANLLGKRLLSVGSPLTLKRAFNNLIQNAFKYGSKVWLKLNCNKENIIIEIEDDGPGIPQQELNKVFQAYYRTKNVSAESSTGVGLGLTIAHEIIHAHQGTIKLKNRLNQTGLQVIIILPVTTG